MFPVHQFLFIFRVFRDAPFIVVPWRIHVRRNHGQSQRKLARYLPRPSKCCFPVDDTKQLVIVIENNVVVAEVPMA